MSARIQSAEAARGAPPLPAAPSAVEIVASLTPAERRVLAVILAGDGFPVRTEEIAHRASVSPKSVASIVFWLREKGVPVQSKCGYAAPGYWVGKEQTDAQL